MEMDNANVCPKNYILLGDSRARKQDAEAIIKKNKTNRPELFEGKKPSFTFELRYVPPFEKNFHELKRLQATAADMAGRRDEFKGYIVLDMNPWLVHHEEAYLNITLLFLLDMSDYWQYIFLVNDDQNPKAARALVGKILAVFFQDHIVCEIKEADKECSYEERIRAICKEQGVICTAPVKELLEELLAQKFDTSIVSALLNELVCYSGKKVSMQTVIDFMAKREPLVRYMLPQKEYDRLMNVIHQQKEENRYAHDEKEAI